MLDIELGHPVFQFVWAGMMLEKTVGHNLLAKTQKALVEFASFLCYLPTSPQPWSLMGFECTTSSPKSSFLPSLSPLQLQPHRVENHTLFQFACKLHWENIHCSKIL